MDLISIGLRTIFYDINVAEVLADFCKGKHDYLDNYFNRLSVAHESHFTLTELNAIRDFIKQKVGITGDYRWSVYFKLLPEYCSKCLKLEGNHPMVIYDQLFSWRYLSLLLGEEILVAAFLSDHSKMRQNYSFSFDWPSVLPHDNQNINKAMEDGVSDIHAHQMASADIFELTWLDMMHLVVNRDYSGLISYTNAELKIHDGENNISIARLIQIAAFLRVHLFLELNEKPDGKLFLLHTLLKKEDKWIEELKNTQATIDQSLQATNLQYSNGYIDYCHTNAPKLSSVYAVHYGERSLLYRFFRGFYENNNLQNKVADYMFLYVIIKNRIRREFVQNNLPNGFENFKIFENRKSKYATIYKKLYPQYAIQSSFRIGMCDTLELRVAPKETKGRKISIPIPDMNFKRSLWLNSDITYSNISRDSLTFVVHLLKRSMSKLPLENKTTELSRFGYRHDYRRQIDAIIEDTKNRQIAKNNETIYDIVGIDAAGNELHCSPEVFGHTYRYARTRGLVNLTYHVGEDFFDLADGLMNIDHAVVFLGLKKENRIGHAIALGVDSLTYYEGRNFQLIASRQRLLDILVWVLGVCRKSMIDISEDTNAVVEKKSRELYYAIGYHNAFDVMTYYNSQLLRSDDIWCQDEGGSKWAETKDCPASECSEARKSQQALSLNRMYQMDKDVIRRGNEIDSFVLPHEWADIIYKLQTDIIGKIRQQGIVIESCPTSNLRIGPILSYEESPLFVFLDKGLAVTANTDDKGVFATSEIEEISLIAASKRAYSSGKYPQGVVRHLVDNGKKYRFKASDNHIV